MDTSIFFARLFGLAYIILAIGMLLNRKSFRKIMQDFGKNTGLVFYSGFLALFIGLTIVLLHNRWVANWTVIITIFGWAGVIKGIWLLYFPESVPKFMQGYVKHKSLINVHAATALVIGVLLTWLGFK
jgi:uncharacterized membrane protein